jgi:hypothetical protein
MADSASGRKKEEIMKALPSNESSRIEPIFRPICFYRVDMA